MIVKDISEPTPSRIRWLSSASRESVLTLCSHARVTDPAEVHCARFALHLAMAATLPNQYAWEVLGCTQYSSGRNAYAAPLEGHVLTMAMYAADFDAVVPDFVELCCHNNPELERAAIFRFARSTAAIDDERLRELAFSDNDRVRRAIARLLEVRDSRYRKEILRRLIDDPVRRVSQAASWSAGRIKEPELADLLVSKGNLYSLSFQGDPRARRRVEALVNSPVPADGEEAVAIAIALGDLEVLAKLWEHREWNTRLNAILGSVANHLIGASQIEHILTRESAEHIAELALRWPQTEIETLSRIARLLAERLSDFPSADALAAGRAVVLDRVRGWIATAPNLCGAAIRLVPEDTAVLLAQELLDSPHAGARAAAVRAVAYRRLKGCFPRVSELCLDQDAGVAEAAARSAFVGRMRCGVYGLDTAILRAGRDYRAGVSARHNLGQLIEALLGEEPQRRARGSTREGPACR